MSDPNPYSDQQPQQPPQEPPPDQMTGQQVYNLVTDTTTGVNVRADDNLFQAAAIAICLLLGAGIGYFCTRDGATGAIFGGFLGLLVGLFGSGIFLMIYRAIMHSTGKHD